MAPVNCRNASFLVLIHVAVAVAAHFIGHHTLVGIIMGIQWIMGFVAVYFKTEKWYDATGSLTYLLVLILSFSTAVHFNGRVLVLTICVMVWALRLGSFLLQRVSQTGEDKRFRQAKEDPLLFLIFWALQGLWINITLLPVFLLHRLPSLPQRLGFMDHVWLLLWLVGFLLEVVADAEKTAFRANRHKKHPFITSGLWKYSRHPNYFGEIVMWIAIFLFCSAGMQPFELVVSAISPVFLIVLLRFISGIPLLEQAGEKKWGKDPAYRAYKEKTNLLIPWRN